MPSQQENEYSIIHFRAIDTGKTLVRQGSFRPWHPQMMSLFSEPSQHDNEKLDCYVAKLGIDIGIAIGIGFSA
jgi:hypothetical protein